MDQISLNYTKIDFLYTNGQDKSGGNAGR
jgi:hypothetical protein